MIESPSHAMAEASARFSDRGALNDVGGKISTQTGP